MSYPPPNSDASIARLFSQNEAMRGDLTEMRTEMREGLATVAGLQRETNGRVRDLEAFKIRMEAAQAVRSEHADGEVADDRDRREKRLRVWLAAFAVIGSIISGVTVAAITVALLPT